MNILVTGGAGFIGSHVCEKLISRGDRVIIVDNLNDYYNPEFKKQNLELLKDASFYQVDITDFKNLTDVFLENQIEKIVHLAARAGVRASLEEPLLYTDVNCIGTTNVLELARKHEVKSVVFGSSSSVYGDRKNGPFKELDNEDNQISPYAVTKRVCEHICRSYAKLFKLKITCLRFFTVYGPRGRPDMAPRMFSDKIMRGEAIDMFGDGSTKRDYTYVSDIVAGILSALDKELEFEIINLGNGNPVVLKDFISIIEDKTGKTAKINKKPMQPGDVGLTFADITKAQKLLDYAPKVGIEEGLGKVVEWMKERQ